MSSGVAFPNRAALEAYQLAALRSLIGALIPANPFYAPKLTAARLGDDLPDLETFFARMPFTAKQELVDDQSLHPPYGTNLTYPIERYTRYNQTSGTTGAPLRWLDTTESWNWMVGNWRRVLQTADITADDRLFFAFSFGPFLGFWTAFEAGTRLGCLCVPGGGMSTTARLRAILDNGITALCCTPTYAIRLGETAQEENLSMEACQVRRLFVAGEPGASIPATRARLERLWRGAQVSDHHGMTEIGPVSYECPQRRGVLHIMEDSFLPEVIDPMTGAQIPQGGRGELVLTNLGRTGSPLLRYRTGDLVQTAKETSCLCGTAELALEGGILGRADDMVVVRGVNLYPAAIEDILRGFERVAEYRVELGVERAMQEVTIQIEPIPDDRDPDALAQEVEAALRTAFHLRLPVSCAPPGSLPRFELKAKRWVRVS